MNNGVFRNSIASDIYRKLKIAYSWLIVIAFNSNFVIDSCLFASLSFVIKAEKITKLFHSPLQFAGLISLLESVNDF